MTKVEVSTVKEVLEQLRQDVVADLQHRKIKVPQEALAAEGWERAVAAWVRLQNRSVPAVSRAVHESPDLLERDLDTSKRAAVATIRSEFERGEDMTHRLTRYYYKAGFNDFLFNTFGIHHLHLGSLGEGQDSTKRHAMSGGADELLFAIIHQADAYLLDVLNHKVFDDARMTKSLVRIVQRTWPNLLERYVVPVEDSDPRFEIAFDMAKKGATVLFEVDGMFYASGNVLDGKVRKLKGPNGEDAGYERSACTSIAVIRGTHHVLNTVAALVDAVSRDADRLADQVEKQTGTRPTAFRLHVIQIGRVIVIQDECTGLKVMGYSPSGTYQVVFPPTVN